MMWTIWGSRNSNNHGEVKYQPKKSMELVNELITSLEIPPKSVMNRTLWEVQKWVRPEEGWVKLNCDSTLNSQDCVAGAGVVVRDDTGEFMLVEGRRYDHIIDPGTVELLACRDAILLARARGWTRIVVETDCQLIVKAWENGKMQRSAVEPIVQEMKATVSDFQGF